MQVLVDQGNHILDRCNCLTKYHSEEQFNQYHSVIGNEIKILGEEIDKYNAKVASLKSNLETFGAQTL